MIREISRVCDCGKGYRSWHDILCGNCRGKSGDAKLALYHKRLSEMQADLQREMYGFYVHDVGGPNGTLRVDFLEGRY